MIIQLFAEGVFVKIAGNDLLHMNDVIESHHAMISPCNEHGRESRLPHLSRTLDRDDWGVLQHLPCSFEQLPWTQGEQFRHAGIVAVQMPVPLIRRPCNVDLPLSNC